MWVLDPFHHHHPEFGEPDEEAMYANPFASGFNLASASRFYDFQADRDNAVEVAKATGQTVHIHPDYQIELRDPVAATPATKSASAKSPGPTAAPSPPKDISSAIVITTIEPPGSKDADTGAEPIYEGEGTDGHITGYSVSRSDGWTAVYDANGQLIRTVLTLQGGAVYFDAKGEQQGSRIDAGDRHGWYDSSGKFFGQTAVDWGTQGADYLRSPVEQELQDATRKYEGALADSNPNVFTLPIVSDVAGGGVSINVTDDSPRGWHAVSPNVSDAAPQTTFTPDARISPKKPENVEPLPQGPDLILQQFEKIVQSASDYLQSMMLPAEPPDPALIPMVFPKPAPAPAPLFAAPPSPANPLGVQVAPPRPIAETADFYNFGGPLVAGRTIADSSRVAKVGQPDKRYRDSGEGQEFSPRSQSAEDDDWIKTGHALSDTPGLDLIYGEGTQKERSHMAAWRELHPDSTFSYNVRMENGFALMSVETLVLAAPGVLAEGAQLAELTEVGLKDLSLETGVPRRGLAVSVEGTRDLGGRVLSSEELADVEAHLGERGVAVEIGSQRLPFDTYAQFDAFPGPAGKPAVLLGPNPTEYEVLHELLHVEHWEFVGDSEEFVQMDLFDKEHYVYQRLRLEENWERLNDAEKVHAQEYILDVLIKKRRGYK